MSAHPPARGHLDWLLAGFAREAPGVVHALVVSSDGLALAATSEVTETLADQLAAATSGLTALASGATTLLQADPVHQTIVESAAGYLFVTSIGPGALLTVFTTRDTDLGQVGYEMTMLAARVGHALTPDDRPDRAPVQ